jgi:uncharacterized protein involved in tolerance to divalent cations
MGKSSAESGEAIFLHWKCITELLKFKACSKVIRLTHTLYMWKEKVIDSRRSLASNLHRADSIDKKLCNIPVPDI